MGRGPSKPTALRALEGGRSNSLQKPEEALAKEPKPRPVCPAPPKELTTRAKKIWKKLAPRLFALGLLTELDEDAFFILCHDLAAIRELAAALKEGNLFENKEEMEKRKLMEVLLYRKTNSYMKHAKEFGLTPRGRVGLVVGGDGKRGEGADLLT